MKPWVQDFTVGVTHTISLGNYENIKVKASITIGVHAEATEEEFFMLRKEAQARLRELVIETQAAQKRQKHATEELTR